jgi:hypothetical protein
MRRLGIVARGLGVLLCLRRVFLTLHVVILAMLFGGGAMRLGGGLVMFRSFGVSLLHVDCPLAGKYRHATDAALNMFAQSANVVLIKNPRHLNYLAI